MVTPDFVLRWQNRALSRAHSVMSHPRSGIKDDQALGTKNNTTPLVSAGKSGRPSDTCRSVAV
jgi:hypothetical protein